MSVLRSINTNQLFSNSIVSMVVDKVGGSVAVVVAPLSMVTEAVSVFHTKIKTRVMADKFRETDERRGHVVEPQPLVDLFV